MNWTEAPGNDEHHVVWLLRNDKNELLARIEGFGGAKTETWYPWIMDVKKPDVLRRVGPSSHRKIDDVKAYCVKVLSGDAPQNHKTAGERRDRAYRGTDQ